MVITAVTCCYVWCIIILFVAPTTAPSTSNKNTGAIIGGVIGGVVFIIIVIVLVVYFTRRDDKRKLWYQVFLYFFSLRRNFHSKVSFLKVPLERLYLPWYAFCMIESVKWVTIQTWIEKLCGQKKLVLVELTF